MRVAAIAFLIALTTPAASAPLCAPSRWILSDGGGRTFTVLAYGQASSGRYTAIALRGQSAGETYFVTNEYIPQATGGPWSSSKAPPAFKWNGRPVVLKWSAGKPDSIESDLSVFEGPLEGDWKVSGCRK